MQTTHTLMRPMHNMCLVHFLLDKHAHVCYGDCMDGWLNSAAMEGFLKNALRRAFSRTRTSSNARHAARREIKVGSRTRVQYKCNNCNEWHWRPDTQIDHIDPVEDHNGSMRRPDGKFDWNKYIDRLFTDKLQILCKKCHAAKSKLENAKRRSVKKAMRRTDGN